MENQFKLFGKDLDFKFGTFTPPLDGNELFLYPKGGLVRGLKLKPPSRLNQDSLIK